MRKVSGSRFVSRTRVLPTGVSPLFNHCFPAFRVSSAALVDSPPDYAPREHQFMNMRVVHFKLNKRK